MTTTAHRLLAVPMPLAEGFAAYLALNASEELYPADGWDEAHSILARLGTGAARAGATTMADLTGPLAATVVAHAAGLSRPSAAKSEEEQCRYSTARNLLAGVHAATMVAAMTANGQDDHADPGVPGQWPFAEMTLVDLPTPVAPRRGRRQVNPRPHRDDEIALLRIHYLMEMRPNSLRAGNAYALCESGLLPGDTTAVGEEHLNDPLTPSTVLAPARDTRLARALPLTGFAARLLTRNLALMAEAGQPRNRLTFAGGIADGGSATASVSGMLARHARWAGLDDANTNPSSITYWQYRRVLLARGQDAALRFAFGDTTDLTGAQMDRRKDRLHNMTAVPARDVALLRSAA